MKEFWLLCIVLGSNQGTVLSLVTSKKGNFVSSFEASETISDEPKSKESEISEVNFEKRVPKLVFHKPKYKLHDDYPSQDYGFQMIAGQMPVLIDPRKTSSRKGSGRSKSAPAKGGRSAGSSKRGSSSFHVAQSAGCHSNRCALGTPFSSPAQGDLGNLPFVNGDHSKLPKFPGITEASSYQF